MCFSRGAARRLKYGDIEVQNKATNASGGLIEPFLIGPDRRHDDFFCLMVAGRETVLVIHG